MGACRIGSSEQGTTLEITRLSGDTRQLWFPVRTLRPTVICFSFELPSVCAPRHDTFLFRRAALSARPPALPSCLSTLSATWSIRNIHPRARPAPSTQCHLQPPQRLRLRAHTAPGVPATTDPPASGGQRPTTTSTGLHRRSRMIGRITVSSEMGAGTTSTTSCCRTA